MRKTVIIFLILSAFRLGAQNPVGKQEKFNRLFIEGVKEYILQNYQRSLDLFTETLNYTDTVPAVYFYLALNHAFLGDRTAAEINIRKAIRMQPENRIFKKTADTLFKTPAAVTPRKIAAKNRPSGTSEANGFLSRINELSPAERYNRGRALSEKYPFDARLIYETAHAAFQLKKYDEAYRLLLNGMDFASVDVNLLKKYYLLLSRIAKAQGKYDKAEQWKQKAEHLSNSFSR